MENRSKQNKKRKFWYSVIKNEWRKLFLDNIVIASYDNLLDTLIIMFLL
jgi:hypothetical protein